LLVPKKLVLPERKKDKINQAFFTGNLHNLKGGGGLEGFAETEGICKTHDAFLDC